MSSEPKKISFGFTKVVKKQDLSKPKENIVELIDCIEAQTIKVVGADENKTKKGPLVIPLKRPEKSGNGILSNLISIIKEETGQVENIPAIEKAKNESETDDKIVINGAESLDELAAKEILNDLRKTEAPTTKIFNVPLSKEVKLLGEKESTLDDYENIPIADFGLAMLRGMGWEEGKGVGKNEKQIMVAVPELRPKGLGLGADRPSSKQSTNHNKSDTKQEDLQIKKGAFVRIVMGKNVDAYGQIEGLDDDAGRLFVKMALGGNKLSLNEFMVEPVTKSEYDKNARVLNSKKYEEYKNKDSAGSKTTEVKREIDDDDIKQMSRKKEAYDDINETNDDKTGDNIGKMRERRDSSAEDTRHHSKYEHSSKRDDKYSTKYHKSKKSHKKHKKSKRYSSEDSSSSEDRNKDKRRYHSPDRKRSSHRSEEKSSRSRRERSRSREKKHKESRYRD